MSALGQASGDTLECRCKSMKLLLSTKIFFHQHLSQLKSRLSNPNTWVLLFGDVCCIFFAHLLAYAIRFEFQRLPGDVEYYLSFIPFLIMIKVPVFYLMNLYSGMWRYTGLRDLKNIIFAVSISSLLVVSILVFENRFEGYSRSILLLDGILTFLFICGLRISIRWFLHSKDKYGIDNSVVAKRLLIIGAGSSGEKTFREISENQNLGYKVVGFLDDDAKKKGLRIHNVPVWGNIANVADCARQTLADELLIAISAISGKQMQRIVSLCKKTNLPYKIIPGYGEVIDGRVSTGIREISYKDLLGRAEVQLETDKIGGYLTDKVVLVTGGGGSIGSELIRQIVRFSPEKIVIFEASEENLYNIQMELLHEYGLTNVVPVLGKIQDQRLLSHVFNSHRPGVVFHAAAYKHVPLIEDNPWQAVDNNIVASQLLMEAAIIYGVSRFVVVSTDKAVRPASVMGASKRIVELLMSAYRKKNWQGNLSESWGECIDSDTIQHKTVFMAVRFGNVLGSSGSVIPLFKKQIKNGGPVTVTHPDVTRYFMSIEEASQLILQAGAMAKGGEIFILKMGEPIKIANLASDLIELAGKKVDEEIEIIYTGLRPGEKLYEELITEGEGIVETGHEKIMVLEGEETLTDMEVINAVARLTEKAVELTGETVREEFKKILPEYAMMLEKQLKDVH